MAYEIHLAAFDGPFDLLLHLIQKNEIDIYDIPIAEITAQYLEYLAEMKKYLSGCQRENRRILELRYPGVQELVSMDRDKAVVFWNRYYKQKDFLFFRLGITTKSLPIPS